MMNKKWFQGLEIIDSYDIKSEISMYEKND
jgi:hypothetical protein